MTLYVCRQYYLCIGGVPREYGCPLGAVFNIGSGNGVDGECSDPELVSSRTKIMIMMMMMMIVIMIIILRCQSAGITMKTRIWTPGCWPGTR